MDPVKTIPFDYGTIGYIKYDEEPESPREWDNLGKMFCVHDRYNLGDPELRKQDNIEALVLPLYLLDHSGLTIRTVPFSCPWDSGQGGYIWVSYFDILEEFGDLSNDSIMAAKARLETEVRVYNDYLQGDVYCFQLVDAGGEVIDSCYGFIGDIEYTEQELRASALCYEEEIRERLAFEAIQEVGPYEN